MTNTRTDAARFAIDPNVLGVIALVFAGAVAGTIYFCRSMAGGMEMPGGWTMSMMWMRMPGQTWAASAAMFLLMWLAMMVAMMLPSALPMLLGCRRGPLAPDVAGPGMLMTLTAGGYFMVWLAIGAVVYVAGVACASATMRSVELSRAVPSLSGAVLVLSGLAQFTHWKMSSLRQCRDSAICGTPRTHGTPRSAWRHGLKQGALCAVCCASPMCAMLVLGAMNLAVMLLVAVVIAMEKLLPKPGLVVRISGMVLVIVGAVMIVRALS